MNTKYLDVLGFSIMFVGLVLCFSIAVGSSRYVLIFFTVNLYGDPTRLVDFMSRLPFQSLYELN
jgi:hypothetical protein